MSETHPVEVDFVKDMRRSVAHDWIGFDALLAAELACKEGTVDTSRYQAVRGILKNEVLERPETVFKRLAPFVEVQTPLEDLNKKLFFIVFEQFIESIIARADLHERSSFGDVVPRPELFDVLTDCLQKETRLRGEHGAVLFWTGIMHHIARNRALAAKYLEHAAGDTAHGFKLAHYLTGASTIRPFQAISDQFPHTLPDAYPLELPLTYKQKSSTGDEELVIFSCADETYFKALSALFLNSIDSLKRRICVHVHIAAHDLNKIDLSSLQQYDNITVDVSCSRIGAIKDRSWFTVLRWLLMPGMIEEYGKLVVTSDFDVEYIPQNFDSYVENLRSYDVGLNINPFPRNRFPWTTINANQLACNATPVALAFAQELRRQTLDYFDPARTDQWWIDQNVLFACVDGLRHSRLSAKIYNNFETPVKKTISNKKDLVAQVRAVD